MQIRWEVWSFFFLSAGVGVWLLAPDYQRKTQAAMGTLRFELASLRWGCFGTSVAISVAESTQVPGAPGSL